MLLLPKTMIYIGNTLIWFYGLYHQLLDVIYNGLLETIYNNMFKPIHQAFGGIFIGIFIMETNWILIIM